MRNTHRNDDEMPSWQWYALGPVRLVRRERRRWRRVATNLCSLINYAYGRRRMLKYSFRNNVRLTKWWITYSPQGSLALMLDSFDRSDYPRLAARLETLERRPADLRQADNALSLLVHSDVLEDASLLDEVLHYLDGSDDPAHALCWAIDENRVWDHQLSNVGAEAETYLRTVTA